MKDRVLSRVCRESNRQRKQISSRVGGGGGKYPLHLNTRRQKDCLQTNGQDNTRRMGRFKSKKDKWTPKETQRKDKDDKGLNGEGRRRSGIEKKTISAQERARNIRFGPMIATGRRVGVGAKFWGNGQRDV